MTKSLWDTTCGNVGRMGAWEHLRYKLSAGPCREMELEQAGGKEARTGTEQVVLDVHGRESSTAGETWSCSWVSSVIGKA